MRLNKIHKSIMKTLGENPSLPLDEISQNLDMPKKKVFRALRKLFQEGLIETRFEESQTHYKLSEKS